MPLTFPHEKLGVYQRYLSVKGPFEELITQKVMDL